MKKSSKVLSSVLACAMLAAVAATAVSAAEPVEQSTTVGYRAGTTDPGGTGSYLVEIPRDVTLTKQDEAKDFSVDLLVWNASTNDYEQATSSNFPTNKQVKVQAASANGYKLKKVGNTITGDEGTYTYKVKTTEGQQQQYNKNITGGEGAKADVGVLSSDRVDISGQVTLTGLPKRAVKGDVYKDTVTFTLTEEAKGN